MTRRPLHDDYLRRIKKAAWRAQGKRCFYCIRHLSQYQTTLDHVVPLVRGGLTVGENLVIACEECNNLIKGMLEGRGDPLPEFMTRAIAEKADLRRQIALAVDAIKPAFHWHSLQRLIDGETFPVWSRTRTVVATLLSGGRVDLDRLPAPTEHHSTKAWHKKGHSFRYSIESLLRGHRGIVWEGARCWIPELVRKAEDGHDGDVQGLSP